MEEAAARAYNVEAERLGLTLNVIPPVGAAGAGVGLSTGGCAGAGPKRALPESDLPAARVTVKKLKLVDTSSSAAGASRVTAAHLAKLNARVRSFKHKV